MADRPLYAVSRLHLEALAGEFGIWQHARGSTPDESFGYCTDDVARALQVDLLHARQLGWGAVRVSAERSLGFLEAAFNPTSGRFRNFRSRDGSWLEATGSDDSHGRAILALGSLLAAAPDDAAVRRAEALLLVALPAGRRLGSPRAIASTVLGCGAAMTSDVNGRIQATLEDLALGLGRAFGRARIDADWPWPEETLTYENALLPRAVMAAGSILGDYELRRTGLRAFDWLIAAQTGHEGSFAPIGSAGWWPRGGVRARFDQQPIEATATILAAAAALHYTGEERYLRTAEAAYGWFLGDNELGVRLADPRRGSCRDGLTPEGANQNEGAESTLMWQMALEEMRAIRVAAAMIPEARPPTPISTGAQP